MLFFFSFNTSLKICTDAEFSGQDAQVPHRCTVAGQTSFALCDTHNCYIYIGCWWIREFGNNVYSEGRGTGVLANTAVPYPQDHFHQGSELLFILAEAY